MDAQEPHLRTLLSFIGITDVTYLRAERLAFGPEAREQSISGVRRQLGEQIQDRSRWAA
jgi:FMN-dependent NADH-azoreductase